MTKKYLCHVFLVGISSSCAMNTVQFEQMNRTVLNENEQSRESAAHILQEKYKLRPTNQAFTVVLPPESKALCKKYFFDSNEINLNSTISIFASPQNETYAGNPEKTCSFFLYEQIKELEVNRNDKSVVLFRVDGGHVSENPMGELIYWELSPRVTKVKSVTVDETCNRTPVSETPGINPSILVVLKTPTMRIIKEEYDFHELHKKCTKEVQ